MNSRQLLIGLRLFFGGLVWFAVVYQAGILHGLGTLRPINYVSYFTILSNLFAATVCIISTWYLMKGRQPTRSDDLVRGASVLYMTITGVIYVLLLRGIEVNTDLAWVNATLHYIMPVVVVADWLYQPQAHKLGYRQTWTWLIFPLCYLVYSLIRGPIAQWYPYPFLNPDHVGGYGGVVLYCLGILMAFMVLGWLLMQAGNKLRRHVM
jgi:hypothetical protein